MTTDEFTAMLTNVLYESEIDACEVESVRSFRSAGVLSSNEGAVVRMEDGSEFQLTVVQSRHAS
jgi:hypothetical protein